MMCCLCYGGLCERDTRAIFLCFFSECVVFEVLGRFTLFLIFFLLKKISKKLLTGHTIEKSIFCAEVRSPCLDFV
jgi:hypothetical protein